MKKIALEIEQVRSTVIAKLLKHTYLSQDQAKLVAEQIIYAEASGKFTHGLIRVPWFINKGIKTHNSPKLINEGGFDRFECSDSIGYIAAEEICENIAKEDQNISIAVAENIFPTGVLNYYIKKYCGDSLFLIFGTTPKLVSYKPKSSKITGTNPFAFGCSFENEFFVADITTTKSSFGDLLLASKNLVEFNPSSYLDSNGNNPKYLSDLIDSKTGEFTGSIFQPLIEKLDYKLYSFNIIIELLTKLFAGKRSSKGDTVFIKMSKELFGGKKRVNDLLLDFKKSMNFEELPGQHSHNLFLKNIQSNFIHVDNEIWEDIINL